MKDDTSAVCIDDLIAAYSLVPPGEPLEYFYGNLAASLVGEDGGPRREAIARELEQAKFAWDRYEDGTATLVQKRGARVSRSDAEEEYDYSYRIIRLKERTQKC